MTLVPNEAMSTKPKIHMRNESEKRTRGQLSQCGFASIPQIGAAHHRAVYGLFHRAGLPHHDAEDLTQSFWHKMIRLNVDIGQATPDHYFNGYARRFLANWFRDQASLQRRLPMISMADLAGDGPGSYVVEFSDPRSLSPDSTIERKRIILFVCRTLAQQREFYMASGREELFDALCNALSENKHVEWSNVPSLPAAHGLSPGALRILAHRMRKRLRDALIVTFSGPEVHQPSGHPNHPGEMAALHPVSPKRMARLSLVAGKIFHAST